MTFTEIRKTQKREIERLLLMYKQLKHNAYKSLYHCYKNFSQEKHEAFNDCLEIEFYVRDVMKEEIVKGGIIGYNIFQFSYGIITDKAFYYITKCDNKRIDLQLLGVEG